MRIIGRFPNQSQVNDCVDSLKNDGFDRKDMIISDLADERTYHNAESATDDGFIFVKSETESLNDYSPYWKTIEGLESNEGIIIAVDTAKREASRVRSFMEESGAIEIIQD